MERVHLSKRARRRTLAYFLVIHSIACLDNAPRRAAPAGQPTAIFYGLAPSRLSRALPFSTDIFAFAFTLRSPAHVCANVTSASAIGDAIRRLYCYYVAS